jgi:hypothetical protein
LQEEHAVDDNDGIEVGNIVLGKRTRNQTDFYVDKDHASLLLADVPEDEYDAAVMDEDLTEDYDTSDGYDEDEDEMCCENTCLH